VLLLAAQVRSGFLFFLLRPFVHRSVDRSVGRLLGWLLRWSAGSVIRLFVRGLRVLNESGPVIIRSCYLSWLLTPPSARGSSWKLIALDLNNDGIECIFRMVLPASPRACSVRARTLKNRFISARSYDAVASLAASSFDRRHVTRSRPASRSAGCSAELNWRLNNFPFLAGDIHQLSKLKCNALLVICAVCDVVTRCISLITHVSSLA